MVHLSKLAALEDLDLGQCRRMDEEGFAHVSTLPRLAKLCLWGCAGVNEQSLSRIATMKTLRVLDLRSCIGVNERCVETLSRVRQLHKLDLRECCNIDLPSARKKKFHSLSCLDCRCFHDRPSSMSIPDLLDNEGCRAEPDPLQTVTHALPHRVVSQVLRPVVGQFVPPEDVAVRTRHDANCCITSVRVMENRPEVFDFAAQLPHLETFKVHELYDDYDGFAKLTQLRRLVMSHCDNIDAAFYASLPLLTQLRHICIWDCAYVNVTDVTYIADHPLLEELLIAGRPVDADGLAHIARLPNLRELKLNGCTGVDAAGLAHLSTLPRLQALDLTECDGVEVDGLAHLKGLSELRTLVLKGCPNVTDAGVAHVSAVTSLHGLDLRACPAVKSGALPHLLGMHKLTRLCLPSRLVVEAERVLPASVEVAF